MKTEELAEEIYAYYDDIFSRDITVDEKTTDQEITDFVKKCSRFTINKMIFAIDKSNMDKAEKQQKIGALINSRRIIETKY